MRRRAFCQGLPLTALGLGCQASLAAPPAVFSLAGGMPLWLDSDYSGGVSNGDTPNPQNRIAGSDVATGKTSGSVIWEPTGWQGQRVQSAWSFTDGSLRSAGSMIAGIANGTGKNWYYGLLCCPNFQNRSAPNTSMFLAGFDKLSAASFTRSAGMTAGNNTRCTVGVYPFTGGALDTPQSAITHQAAMLIEVQRIGGNQIQFALNGVWGAPQPYQAGLAADVDGFSWGGWFGGGVGNGFGSMRMRAGWVLDHPPSAAELADIRRYTVGPTGIYTGLETVAALGATGAFDVHPTLGQSNQVPDTPDGVTNPYAGLTSQVILALDGLTRPYVEPLSDFARSSTWPINHQNPDINPGQSAFGAFAAQLQSGGDIHPRIFVPTARGSTSCVDWLAGVGDVVPSYQNLLGAFKHATMAAMQAPGARIGLFWWNQGEADAQDATLAANYQTNLTTLFDAILTWATATMGYTFAKAQTRFVIAGLPLNSTLTFAGTVRAAQQAVAAARPDTVYVQQPNISGAGIHLYAPEQITLGTGYGVSYPSWP